MRSQSVQELCRGRFNRTFMELKCACQVQDYLCPKGFNRTFMELKFTSCKSIYYLIIVLIVPLWN